MKHPRYEILQDYFENALNSVQEDLVKEHLLNCDDCTRILSDFTQIETKMKSAPIRMVSQDMKAKIFADAKLKLAQKKNLIQEKQNKKLKMKEFIEEWQRIVFPEIKIPALQIVSVSVLLAIVVLAGQMEDRKEEYYKPLSNDVHEFTFKDISQDSEE